MQYIMRIELLSDLCPSSGEVYNSSVDTDIDYDNYGFPFISAKRLKGCLRETAILLREWGKEVPVEEIFGAARNKNSNFRLENAKLEGYDTLKADAIALRNCSDKSKQALSHPQNILNLYSYIRTQTAMEYGVAKEGSLRVLRVLKKGLCFDAIATFDEKYYSVMQDICKATRNMGLNRTRGMGEIRITLVESIAESMLPLGYEHIAQQVVQENRQYRLSYRIKLLEPMVLKSVNRGQEKTQDYVEGSKMLGVIASALGNERYLALTADQNIYCSNLYVTNNEKRYTPIAASIQKKKDDTENIWYDIASGFETEEQMKKAGNGYVMIDNNKVYVLNVATQLRYHHSRPEDKSIGRARGNGIGEFYQISSILDGQSFSGFIQCTGKQLPIILEVLSDKRYLQVGYGHSAEYGKVELYLDALEEHYENGTVIANTFAVKLDAPLIMYNAYGMYSQDPKDLARLLGEKIGTNVEIIPDKMFVKHTMIGGWQRMWQKPKQSAFVLDKGTVLLMKTANDTDITLPTQSIFVGERCAEGYGEIKIFMVPQEAVLMLCEVEENLVNDLEETNHSEFMIQLLRGYDENVVRKAGRLEAQQFVANKNTEKIAPVIHKLLLTLKEQKTKNDFGNVCNSIKNDSKRKLATNIFDTFNTLPECKTLSQEECFAIYMKSFLTEAKYLIRQKEQG